MELKHIPLDQLHLSAVNMRHSKKAPDVSDILPSIRARGILQPLLVRPNNKGFEIVAGRRRYFSAKAVEAEQGAFDPVPCAVMEPGDDAAAIEASLIENIARLDADEMTQYETFAKLIKEGRSVESIATTFGVTDRTVTQRLAIGNLLPKIREGYRAEQIDGESIRYLTMATKAQQKAWLELLESDDGNVPLGYRLKQWLFGGESIGTGAALFPLESYTGQIVTDLFGEDSYFGDTEQFWQLQTKAIEAKRDELLAAKWAEVIVLETGERFDQWAFEKVSKKKGGRVYIAVSERGEVEIFDGWLSRKEARKANKPEKTDPTEKASRPAMTQAMENYLELHRHASVRLSLLASPETALRLLIAHAVASSGNWSVKADPQRTQINAIRASIEKSKAQAAFDAERDAVEALLAISEDEQGRDDLTTSIFLRLLKMSEAEVGRIAAFVMANTLAVGSEVVEAAGVILKTDAGNDWQADETFFELIRDRATLNAMLTEVVGKDVAAGNTREKSATLKQVIRDALTGKNGRTKAGSWLPGWMAFPFRAYTDGNSGLGSTAAHLAALLRRV
jgi:ParB family transcriptional regulator, chromosome partitioning protein